MILNALCINITVFCHTDHNVSLEPAYAICRVEETSIHNSLP
jgi:hypothetical protein